MTLKEAWAKYANFCEAFTGNRDEMPSFADWLSGEMVDIVDDCYLFTDIDIEIPKDACDDLQDKLSPKSFEELASEALLRKIVSEIVHNYYKNLKKSKEHDDREL